MNVGSAIKQYRFKIVDSTAPDGNVAEGDIIPLTKVEREQVKITELKFKNIVNLQVQKLFNHMVMI